MPPLGLAARRPGHVTGDAAGVLEGAEVSELCVDAVLGVRQRMIPVAYPFTVNAIDHRMKTASTPW